jgi:tRNA threonylcarbamoyladenosine biosynthesis protein TsaE
MVMKVYLQNSQATYSFGIALGQSLPPGSVILLEGNLGAGKTTLVQGIGAGLGIKDSIDSPTFTLVNEYLDGRVPLYHLDLYRLESAEVEALNLALYWEGVEMPLGIVAIEWAEKLRDKPDNYLLVCLSYLGEEGREVEIIATGDLSDFQWEISPYFEVPSVG